MNTSDQTNNLSGPSALSIATFVLGMLSFTTGGLTAPPAILTGVIESINIKRGRSSRAGLCLNIIGFSIAIATIVLMFVVGFAMYNLLQPVIHSIIQMAGSPPKP